MIRKTIALAAVALLLIGLGSWLNNVRPTQAQSAFCDQTISITASAASSATIFAAVGGARVYVCAYNLTGDTAATGIQFRGGSTNLTGVMLTVANGNLSAGDGSAILIQGDSGSGMTISATTGAVTGWVKAGQN